MNAKCIIERNYSKMFLNGWSLEKNEINQM